ncbi:putative glycosyltransferase [Leptolyngbya sp. PCC 7375]|nr:putative glycosyltransferase [Leptolyngbya sp. PCC 7375]
MITPNFQQDISIIIPVHNGGDSFKRCLMAVEKLNPQPREVIVVANGDTDGSWNVAKQFGATVVRLPEATGPGIARNMGAKIARGKYLFFIDADVEVQVTTIAGVIDIFNQYSCLAALIGSYDDSPGATNFLSQYRNLLHHYTHQISCENASTFWAGCGAIKRDIFSAMGGFNEQYLKPCIEDIELGIRLKQSGYDIRLCKELQVKHLKRWDALSILKTDIFYRALPWTSLILEHRQFNNDLNLKLENRLSVVLIYFLVFLTIVSICYSLQVLWVILPITIGLIWLNASLYRFFYSKRGLIFSIKAILWHWLYYLYSGLGFCLGLLWYQRYHFKLFRTIVQEKLS